MQGDGAGTGSALGPAVTLTLTLAPVAPLAQLPLTPEATPTTAACTTPCSSRGPSSRTSAMRSTEAHCCCCSAPISKRRILSACGAQDGAILTSLQEATCAQDRDRAAALAQVPRQSIRVRLLESAGVATVGRPGRTRPKTGQVNRRPFFETIPVKSPLSQTRFHTLHKLPTP